MSITCTPPYLSHLKTTEAFTVCVFKHWEFYEISWDNLKPIMQINEIKKWGNVTCNTNTCYCPHSVDWTNLTPLLAMVILWYQHKYWYRSIYTLYNFNTLCDSNVVVHRFIRKALQSLTGARVISTFSVRIETATIVFKKPI